MARIDLLHAELVRTRHRRAAWLIAAATLGLVVFHAWTNYRAVENYGNQEQFWQTYVETEEQRRKEFDEPPLTDEEKRAAELVARRQIESQRDRERQARLLFSPRFSHELTLGLIGTGPGVGITVLLAATLFGAEFRWGYWKTLSTYEPRRGILVAAKLVNLWLLILAGLIVILILSYPLNALFARLYAVQSPPGLPAISSLTGAVGRVWLTTGLYGTAAAALTLWFRSGLAGLGGGSVLVLADGILTLRIVGLRFVFPVQQIAELQPDIDVHGFIVGISGGAWFPKATIEKLVEFEVEGGSFRTFTDTPLPPISDWQAVAVLSAWTLFFVALGYLAVRSRDVPV